MTSGPPTGFSFLLFEAATAYRHTMRRSRGALGVTEAESRVLMYLSGREGISQTELARLLNVKPITVARLIDGLAKGGWLVRRPDPQDRRANRLQLTASGRDVVQSIWMIVSEVGQAVASSFEPGALHEFEDGLEKMRDALAQDPRGGRLLDEDGAQLATDNHSESAG